ncbi:MAG TPA: exosortase A [Casimicrobiaceae bacterium]|nr:exosortase A [Casimicrobiaceae bacterium]
MRHPAILASALALIGILLVHADTALSIVGIWWRAETFAHGFVIVPISLWLVWRRREALAALPAQPWYWGLGAVLAFGAMWLVSTLADVQAARQFTLVFMLQAAAITVIGLRVARQIAFPLFFLLFGVPFGDFLIPPMIDLTADFTVAALRLTGVPVYREANHFVIPSGAWSVVEACSGIRYLIVSVVVGTLYAFISFRSPRLRASFIALAIVVPLVANWLRAYGIVMLGHLSSNQLAVGVDHLIYGWLFFGVVMALLFWLGSYWRESAPAELDRRMPVTAAQLRVTPPNRLFGAALLAIVAASVWVPAAGWLTRGTGDTTVRLSPIRAEAGWTAREPFTSWKPQFKGFGAELAQAFAAPGSSSAVGVYVALFRGQAQRRQLIASSQGLVAMDDWNWKRVGRTQHSVVWAGSPVEVELSRLVGISEQLTVYRLYWIDGFVTSSDLVAKLALAWSRLRGGSGDAALVTISSAANEAVASDTIARFIADMSPAIERTLEAASGTPR